MIKSIDLFNTSGQIISKIDGINNTQTILDISSYKPGMYFLKVNTADKSDILKILIR